MIRYAFATLSLYPLCFEYVSMASTLVGATWDYLLAMLFGIDSRFDLSGRIEIVDSMRGVLLYWMLVSHSLQHAGVPMTHPLQLLRPYGWMSSSFVMLTGTALALIYARSSATRVFLKCHFFALRAHR